MTFTPSHLLVAVAVGLNDDVALAEALVDDACDVFGARGGKGKVTLVYVNPPAAVPYGLDVGLMPSSAYQAMAAAGEANRAHAASTLARLQNRVSDRGLVSLSDIVDAQEGVGEAIAHAAQAHGAELIVLSSHGRRGWKRLFLGSVAERVAHVATMPVLLLRAAPG